MCSSHIEVFFGTHFSIGRSVNGFTLVIITSCSRIFKCINICNVMKYSDCTGGRYASKILPFLPATVGDRNF